MTERGPVSFGVVNAYKAHTGSSSVARSYYDALVKQQRPVAWYQCISSKDTASYESLGDRIGGWTNFRDDYNLVLNCLAVFPKKIGRLREDVAILTDPILLRAAPRLNDPVVIVHDLRELSDQRRSVTAELFYHWVLLGLDHVGHIICDSETTRTELLRFSRPRVPVDVLDPCSRIVGPSARPLIARLKQMAESRTLNVLYIAADRPYKNIPFFCRLAKMMEKPHGGWSFRFRLVSHVGSTSQRLISSLDASNLEVVPSVANLSAAYDEADVLVHPSKWEGFGLPPVEAMQYGVPVVASTTPCIREVVATGGVLLEPEDPNPWIDCLTELTDPDVYANRALASAARGKEFQPEAFESRFYSWMQARLL